MEVVKCLKCGKYYNRQNCTQVMDEYSFKETTGTRELKGSATPKPSSSTEKTYRVQFLCEQCAKTEVA